MSKLNDVDTTDAALPLADERLMLSKTLCKLLLSQVCPLTMVSKFLKEVLVLPRQKGFLHWQLGRLPQESKRSWNMRKWLGAAVWSVVAGRALIRGGPMKAVIKGRAVDIDLAGGQKQLAEQLQSRGLQGKRVESLAAAALKYAEAATADLQQKLVPPEQWPGMVVCCRHSSAEGTAWLMLKREPQGWRFDSALFD